MYVYVFTLFVALGSKDFISSKLCIDVCVPMKELIMNNLHEININHQVVNIMYLTLCESLNFSC